MKPLRSGTSALEDIRQMTTIAALPDAAVPSPSGASLAGLDGINFFNAAMLAGFGPYVAVYLAEQKWTQENIGDGLGEMDVEVVANDIPPCVGGGAAQQGVEKTSKVLLGRVSPITPATLPIVTSKPAIRVCVPWRRYSNSHRSTLPGFIGNPGAMRSSA